MKKENNGKVVWVLYGNIVLSLCSLYGEYGCMDRSFHLDQLNDPKTFHYVTGADGGPCSCHCSRYDAGHKNFVKLGKCRVCNHYRVRRPYIIVKNVKRQKNVDVPVIKNSQLARLFKRR